jgi:hypothetical protein
MIVLMNECWAQSSNQRPQFSDIKDYIEDLRNKTHVDPSSKFVNRRKSRKKPQHVLIHPKVPLIEEQDGESSDSLKNVELHKKSQQGAQEIEMACVV